MLAARMKANFQEGYPVTDGQGHVSTVVLAADGAWRITPLGYRERSWVPSEDEVVLDFEKE